MAVLIPGKLLYLRSPHTASVATEAAIVRASSEAVVIIPGHCTMEEIIHGKPSTPASGTALFGRGPESRDGGVSANELREGGEVIVTTVRNPYDVIVTWWLRATRGEGSFVEFIRHYNRSPQLSSKGEIFTHAKHANVVLQYDTLDEDFTLIMKLLGLPQEKILVDNVTRGKKHWEEYYDASPGARAAVNLRFGPEIEELGFGLQIDQ